MPGTNQFAFKQLIDIIFVQETDPGDIGPGQVWVVPSTGQINIRNSTSTGWISNNSGSAPTPTGTGFVHITSDVQDAAAKLVEDADLSLTAPFIGAATGKTLVLTPASNVEGQTLKIRNAAAANVLQMGTHSNTAAAALWFGNVTPSDSNWTIIGTDAYTFINAPDSGAQILFSVGGNTKFTVDVSDIIFANSFTIRWQSDLRLFRDAASTLGIESASIPSALRIYRTMTDASNYERAAIQSGSGFMEFAAETAGTGTDDLDVKLTPAGSGKVQFGTHSNVGAETVTGFITIKDASGASRKLAVIS